MEIMRIYKWIPILLMILSGSRLHCFDPLLGGSFAIGGVALLCSKWVYCNVKECCNKKWTHHNVSNLINSLEVELFGQYLVNQIVPKVITNHLNDNNPGKALVLSFHGTTGSGKNHVADLIVRHLYKNGVSSHYVHKRISSHHFLYSENVHNYKEDIKELIEKETQNCDRSLFIFDEMDKMPQGLSDVLKPYIDHHQQIRGVDYRKNIFIFLSNLGGEDINRVALKNFLNGGNREDITAKEMEKVLSAASFNDKGGLKSSDLMLSGLIDFSIPFLPLERKHVKQCAEAKFLKIGSKKASPELLEQIASEIQYFPSKLDIFSITGCKLVAKKVSMYL